MVVSIRRISKPGWYGHTTGKWEGDTLVMDTVGFNEKFWLTREGVPTTKQAAPDREAVAAQP